MMMMMMMRYLLVLVVVVVVVAHFHVATALPLTRTAITTTTTVKEEEEEAREDVAIHRQADSPEESSSHSSSTAGLFESYEGNDDDDDDDDEPSSSPLPPPSWDDLDKLPLADWYPRAKFGIFIHWGVFSVPAFGSPGGDPAWFQYYWQNDESSYGDHYRQFVQSTERSNFAYADYAHRFSAQLYRPNNWANVFAKSGAQYVVLTSKHHDGFCNWDSHHNIPLTWNWNAMDIGPRRDLVGELATAIRAVGTSPHTKRNIKFGLYHSLFEFFNPLYLQDKKNNFTTQHFVNDKTLPELYNLVQKYQPELIWSDGDWEAPSSYWKATEFLHWYATQSAVGKAKTAVWNDRWGNDATCHHGAYLTCTDRYNPGPKKNARKWENALTIDKTSWGYNRNSSYNDYMTSTEIIHNLIQVVAWNGNMLLNVGPDADGTIPAIFVDRLLHVGEWLQVNGRAIYDTVPWQTCQNETNVGVYYTTTTTTTTTHSSNNESSSSKTTKTLFAHMTRWPTNNRLSLKCPQPTAETRITMLGMNNETSTTMPDPSSSSSHHSIISWSFLAPKETIVLPKRRRSLQQQEPEQEEHDDSDDSTYNYSHDDDGDDDDDTFTLVIQLPALTPDIIPCQHAWVLELSHIANLQ